MTQARLRATVTRVTGLLLGAVLAASAAPAAATPDEDLLWYYNLLGYEEIHSSGITGEGVTIAVIDSPINLEVPTLQGADIRVQESPCLDENGARRPGTSTDWALADHGTNVVSYIVGTGAGYEGQTGVKGVAPGATVLTYAVYLDDDDQGDCYTAGGDYFDDGGDATAQAMQAAMDAGADIISVSMILGDLGISGPFNEAMIRAVREEVIVVGGLSNEGIVEPGSVGPDSAPGPLTGAVSVLGVKSNGELNSVLNHINGAIVGPNNSEYVVVCAPGWDILWQGRDGDWLTQYNGRGTSIATPIVSGTLALAMQKYPDATGNQILQSMIHNTGTEPHEVEWDSTYGFGFVVPRTLLAADPTQYPAVNPLAAWFSPALRFPTFAEIFPDGNPATQEPRETPSSSADPEPDEQAGTNLGLIALVGGIALLLLILVIVFTVIAVNRKKSS